MKNFRVLAVIVCMMVICNLASADNIRGINIDFVNIGNAGNSADTTGYGAVGYNYRIGKYEVTNAQWDAFVDAAGAPVGYNSSTSFSEQQPTTCVNWYEAAQFCNYLTSGNKNFGAYYLDSWGRITIDRASAISTYGKAYFIPTDDEWYKAAYFKPDGSGYSLYANGTNTAPSTSQACYNYIVYSGPWNIGTGTQEQNGTFDMMGNVKEWDEAFLVSDSSWRGLRGGDYNSDAFQLSSSHQTYGNAYSEGGGLGFRVASVPEPATLLLFGLGGLILRKRK